jgi:uncharacterized protein (TIGR03437 family)
MLPLIGFFLLLPAADSNLAYNIETVAGSDWAPNNSPAIAALLVQTEGIAVDPTGALYVSDAASHRVYKVSPAGTISIVAGNGYPGFAGDGGNAAAAQLNSPYGVAFDGIGNLYIADLSNARIRQIAPNGEITTFAGGGTLPAGGANDGSQATAVSLSAPRNLAWDGHGLLYISDFTAHRVYRLAPDGSLTTVAGTGSPGFSGDGGPGTSAQLAYPTAVAVDRQGSLYIADSQNHLIRKVTNGLISSIARAATPTGLAFDSFGTLYVADPGAGQILTIPLTGAPAAFPISAYDLTVGPDGYVYAATGTEVLQVSFYGSSVTVAGGGSASSGDGGPATLARLNHPAGVAADARGNLYIADRENHRIRRVAPDGTIVTIAGTGTPGNAGDGGLAVQAQLNAPESVTVDANDSLYISDTGNRRVRVISPDGVIFPLLAPGLIAPVYTLADGQGNFYIADSGAGTIVMVNSAGVPTTLVTNLLSPRGLALDGNGNLYFAETGGPHVRRLASDGTLTALGEGNWSAPEGVAIDSSGNLFVADAGLQCILRIDSSGNISTIAGNGTAGFAGDGSSALAAEIGYPRDICTGPGSTLNIADFGNNRIRQLTPGSVAVAAPLLLVSAVNAATLQPGPVAPGMLLDLIGTGLEASDVPNTQVTFNAISTPVLTLDNARLVVQVPPQLEGQQTAQIQIVNQGSPLAEIPVGLVETAPGVFATASGGALANNQDGTVNSTSNPSARGSVIALYGTGGGVNGLPATVTIGGYAADVLYQGPVTGYPGLLQINVRVPAGYVPPGNLSVVVTIGGASSQPGITIAVD